MAREELRHRQYFLAALQTPAAVKVSIFHTPEPENALDVILVLLKEEVMALSSTPKSSPAYVAAWFIDQERRSCLDPGQDLDQNILTISA